jgi:hypothetical protein
MKCPLLVSHSRLFLLNQASHRGRPSSRPGLASGTCGGQSVVGAGFLRVFRVPLPKPLIPPTSPSSQSAGAVTQRHCDELINRPRSTADCPKSSNGNETESFMEAAKAQNCSVEPQEKKNITIQIRPRSHVLPVI